MHKHTEVGQAIVKPFNDILPIVVVQPHADLRMLVPQSCHGSCHDAHRCALCRRDMYIAGDVFVGGHLFLRAIGELDDLLRSAVHQAALLSKFERAGPVAANEQCCADLVFQIFDLPGERWLTDAQRICRSAHAFLLDHGNEVT